MLDINLFRTEKGGDPEIVRESQRRRFLPVEVVDRVIALDVAWRETRFKGDQLRKQNNALNKEVAKKKIAKEPADDLIKQASPWGGALQIVSCVAGVGGGRSVLPPSPPPPFLTSGRPHPLLCAGSRPEEADRGRRRG